MDINDPILTGLAKADIFAVLDTSPAEVPALLAALKEGRIDGEFYEGPCCCLVGTLAKAAGLSSGWDVPLRREDEAVGPTLRRCIEAPAEEWFMAIRQGHTPKNYKVSALTVEWVEEWMAERAEVSK